MASARRPQTLRRQLAVALGYQMDRDAAPRVLAKGQGKVAQRLIELARENDIPIRTDPELVASLAKLDLGEAIPSELYPAVAEVLAWVYRMNQQRRGF